VHKVRRVDVLVLPKKGHWALNLRTLESLSIWEKGGGEDGRNKGVRFYIPVVRLVGHPRTRVRSQIPEPVHSTHGNDPWCSVLAQLTGYMRQDVIEVNPN